MLATLRTALDRLLQWTVIGLMIGLTIMVVVAVVYRKMGASLSWYDEVASVMLAWITYYGAALAALHRQHLGFDSVLLSLPVRFRLVCVVIAEVLVIGFFALLGWAGWRVLQVVGDESLISLPWIPVLFTQSVIPIGAALFIVCELLSLPDYWQKVRAGVSLEHPPLPDADATSPAGGGRN
ncbi:MAG: TRAP transporter small permease [Hyphomicrobiaceae bacterium]